jgi:hypothetical protein
MTLMKIFHKLPLPLFYRPLFVCCVLDLVSKTQDKTSFEQGDGLVEVAVP